MPRSTQTMLVHADLVRSITATLRRRGIPRQDLEDGVADVQVMCEAPTSAPGANPTTSCGQGLGSLRGLHEISGNGSGYAEDTCRKNAADCSQIVVPSGYSPAPDAVDLKVVKPVSGGPPGATAVVTVTLVKK